MKSSKKMKIKNGYYLIRLLTLYTDSGKKIFKSSRYLEIGYWNPTGVWNLIGSDKIYKTFISEAEMNHLDERIIIESDIIDRINIL